jgi:hypothetical protein
MLGVNIIVTQRAFLMGFGALIAIAGLVLLVLRKEQAQNRVRMFGMEFDISTPALVVFLAGCGLFVTPSFVSIKNIDTPIITIGPKSATNTPAPPEPDGKEIPRLNVSRTELKFFEYGRFGEKMYKVRFEKAFTKSVIAEITLHPGSFAQRKGV